MNAIPEAELSGLSRDKRLERVLYAAVRQPLRATAVMTRIGVPFSVREGFGGSKFIHPHASYMDFFFALRRVERFFALHGFVLRKTGGTPFDEIWIEPEQIGSS